MFVEYIDMFVHIVVFLCYNYTCTEVYPIFHSEWVYSEGKDVVQNYLCGRALTNTTHKAAVHCCSWSQTPILLWQNGCSWSIAIVLGYRCCTIVHMVWLMAKVTHECAVHVCSLQLNCQCLCYRITCVQLGHVGLNFLTSHACVSRFLWFVPTREA